MGKAASLQQTRLRPLRLPDPRKTDLRYSELRLILWINAASHQEDRVSLHGKMAASHLVIDAASRQKDLVKSKSL